MQCYQQLADTPRPVTASRVIQASFRPHARPPRITAAASGTSTSTQQQQQQQQQQQLNVVITGGSKGLGFAMAHEFLQAGDSVVLCGRDPERLTAALQHLQQHSALRPQQVQGLQCDVSNAADVQRLTDFVAEKMGRVDRWINNAGQVTRRLLLPELEPADIAAVVGANVLGSLLCCRAAVQLMRQQHVREQQQQQRGARYHIFNCGFSRWGASLSKSACSHKATKMALTQLNISLAEELREAGLGYIGVHNLSPGMVLTDLLLRDANPVARRFFNTLAEEPETVAAAIVPQIRAVQGSGSSIEYLNPASALARVLSGLPQIINGGRFFDKEGNRVAGVRTNSAGVRLLYDYDADRY